MKKKVFTIILLLFCLQNFAQEITPKNSFIFLEASIGYFNYNASGGLAFSIAANYQNKNNIFKIERVFLTSTPFNIDIDNVQPNDYNEKTETSFLYGKRYIKDGFSYSILGGISSVSTTEFNQIETRIDDINFIGFPIEFNIRWFKSKKERMRFLGLIPFGEPTGIGFSNGFKLFGSISKHSYIGLSYTVGFGYYKIYK